MNGLLVRILHFQNDHISTSNALFPSSLPQVVHGQAHTSLAPTLCPPSASFFSRIRGLLIHGSWIMDHGSHHAYIVTGSCSHTDDSAFLLDAVGLDIKKQPHKEGTA
jgi:hypothetical protein